MKSMIEKVFSIKALLSLLLVFATTSAWADFAKTNPVTGETENYTWKFVGTDTWNGTQYWQNSDSTAPAGVPAKSGDSSWGGSDDQWLPILFDGNTIQINAGMLVEGWNLRMGLYNGANITLNHLVKLQSGMSTWFTVDENSTLTIAGMDNNKLEGSNPLCLYSARANGIIWTPALSNSAIGTGVQMPLHYYLAGDGTVAFNGGITLTSAQVIKRADVTLSEATSSKTVRSKTLVSFASTSTSTFSADAETTIKVKNSDGTALKDVNLTSVTATDTTLTTAGNVGDCELVQTTTGVVLYYVDYAKTYKPSININFTNGAGNGLTTSADVGLDGYAVPGTSWNNFVVANNTTFNTVNAIDSTGAASVASGVSVSISGTRGHWNCSNLTPASNPLHGYIDESADGPTPTVTITGIPYEHYRVIVYHSTDQDGAKFGYDTINGFNFTYVDGVQTEGTTSWGSAGASNSAEPIAEGTNTLVSAVLTGDTVTMVAHRIGGGNPTARGCFAAIQVVEYVPEVGENDLEIAVDGATNYAVDTAKTLSGTVYLTGSGTLTLTGSEKITAATIDVAKEVILNINADRLDATTFTGAGTVVYDTTAPVEGKGWANIGWSGTVWIKNQSVSSFEGTKFGNAGSTVRFTGVTGFLQTSSYNNTYVHTVPLELVDEGDTKAFTYNNGWGGNLVKINTLKGTGTLYTEDKGSGEHIYIVDASGFSGVFNLTTKYVYVGGSQPDYSASANPYGKLEIRSGVTMTVPSGKTWTANGGFVVNGTLNVNGTLASSHETKAVSGSGTVVFTGRAPTVSGDAWWKNADWTGTVQVKDVTNMVGDSRTGVWLKFNDYGNSGSVVEMNNVTGWLESAYNCTVPLKISGTLTLNNGASGKNNAFKVGKLLGSGTIAGSGNAPFMVFQITDDWSEFTGAVQLSTSKVVAFGSEIPSTVADNNNDAGTIYIAEGAEVEIKSSSLWWAAGVGFVVDGTLKAESRDKWGGGTAMAIGDTGVLELTSTANVNDANYGSSATSADLSGITGTGTLKYSSTAGWRAFPTADDHMPASTLTLQVELADSLIISKNNGETVIGNLAGSKNIRSDFGSNGGNGRILTVTQSKDTEWEGKFVSNRITQFNVIAPAEGTPGTLTLSGTQSLSGSTVTTIPMQVDGSVNLTGTWVGNTTVSGKFGGTGTVTGNLTFSDGATFKANTSALTISGSNTVTFPSEGSVTVDLTSVELSFSGTTLISGASSIANSANLTASGAYFAVEGDGTKSLVAYAHVATYRGVKYATFADAIAAALADEGGEANLASITVVDATADLPDGYYIENNEVKQYQAAVVGSTGTVIDYYATAQAAVAAVAADYALAGQYDHFEVYNGTDVPITVTSSPVWEMLSVKIKCLNGATVVVSASSADENYSAGEPDENSIVTYTKIAVATTYVWTGATSAEAETNAKNWGRPNNWKIGSASGAAASRAPSSIDTAVLESGAYANIASAATVAAVRIDGAVTLTGVSVTLTATTGGIVLTAAATLTVSGGVTLSPEPTTSLEGKRVKVDNNVYSLVDAIPGSSGDAGYVDGTTAIITNTTSAVTIPAGATSVDLSFSTGSEITLTSESLDLATSGVTVYATDDSGAKTATDITAAFKVTDKGNNTYTVELNPDAKVNGVNVKPEVDTEAETAPMAFDSTAPVFTIKTIPGLWYTVASGATLESLTNGTPAQANEASETLTAPTFTGTVQYYKVKVGPSKASVE